MANKQLKQIEEGKIIEGKDYLEGIVQKIKELEIKNQDNQVDMNTIKRQKKNNEPVDNFKNYIQKLSDYCNSNKIILLRTVGVMFSDEEKRISEYIK